MFGPDVCGFTNRIHVIINYGGKNHLKKTDITYLPDNLSHVYTLVIRPDNSYEVFVDNESKASGKLDEDFDLLLPKEISDPDEVMPEDWDERERVSNIKLTPALTQTLILV